MAGFPEQQPGVLYLTEGGQETELMYKHGHELPEFAMYPLLDNPSAVAEGTFPPGGMQTGDNGTPWWRTSFSLANQIRAALVLDLWLAKVFAVQSNGI